MMKRLFGVIIALFLVATLAVPAVAHAAPGGKPTNADCSTTGKYHLRASGVIHGEESKTHVRVCISDNFWDYPESFIELDSIGFDKYEYNSYRVKSWSDPYGELSASFEFFRSDSDWIFLTIRYNPSTNEMKVRLVRAFTYGGDLIFENEGRFTGMLAD